MTTHTSQVVLVNTEHNVDNMGKTWLAVLPYEHPHVYEDIGNAVHFGLQDYDEFPAHIDAFWLRQIPQDKVREIWAHLKAFELAKDLEDQAGVDILGPDHDKLELGLHLDPYVHDVASLEATGVNNDGLRGQLRYLFLHVGAAEVRRILKELEMEGGNESGES